jgi:mycofactocin system creatininase family protein
VTWPEVASLARACLLVLPVGSYEQHGPHLPLDTDTTIARTLVEAVADEPHVLALPPLAYGASGEHQGFPGTVSIGTRVLTEAVTELVRSARDSGAGVVVVNGHGGNTEGLAAAARRCAAEGDRLFVFSAQVEGGDAHAGRTETSLMLAIAPEQVRKDRLEPGRTEPLETLWPELRSAGVRSVSPNGVLGDPTLASAAEGRQLLAVLTDRLIRALRSWWREVEVAAVPSS